MEPEDRPKGIFDLTSTSRPLVMADILAAIEAIENQPYPEPHKHTVAGGERFLNLTEGGTERCIECGIRFRVENGSIINVGF